MPDHILSKTAELVRAEKWRIRPLKKQSSEVELDEGEEALANVMGQQSRYLLEEVINPLKDEIKALKAIVGRLDKASHAE